MILNIKRQEKLIFLGAFSSFLVSFALMKLSNFSASTIVNFYNYVIKSTILTANTDTIAAIYSVAKPFAFAVFSMVFFVLALSVLAFYGYRNTEKTIGKLVGTFSAVVAFILFPTIAGAFFAVSIFICSFYAAQFSNTYGKELKRWIFFRTGSNTIGKMLLVSNVIMSLGIFFAVFSSQAAYEASFKEELRDSVESLALSLPGASLLPQQMLDERIESASSSIISSKFFSAYIVWLPATATFTAWIFLEILRNLILSNIGGMFTYIMLKSSRRKS